MTTKSYKCGTYSCKAYKKQVGKGWEVGFTMAGHPVFHGNFIHAKEAAAWWTKMNMEVKKFTKKYHPGPKAPVSWYCKFMSNYIYKCYYSYLDTQFNKYHRGFKVAVKKDERKYSHFKKHWGHAHFHQMSGRRAA